MAVRKNPDGSITVGILKDEVPVKEEPKEDAPKKPRRAKAKTNGES